MTFIDPMLTPKRRWLCWLLAPALLFVPLLFMTRVMFFGNSDALFYGNILAMMTESVKAHVFFPLWLPQANAGYGSLAAVMVYAPLSYILTALVNLPFSPLNPDRGTQLLIGMYASQIACGYTSYRWLKRDFDERVAFIGSLLYVLLPYKLIYIYIHINLAQLWVLAVLPLWICAAQEISLGGRRPIGVYALMLAMVYYMHPLTLIAFGAVPAAYALWFGRRELVHVIMRLGVAHVLGFGLCVMQALPQHFYTPMVHTEQLLQGLYNWRTNLYHIDVVLCAYYGIIALLVGVAIWKLPVLAHREMAGKGLFWIVILGGVLFLTQTISTWVWEVITPLQYLQFPAARLHSAALMAVTYLICIWLSAYKEMVLLGNLAYRRTTLALLIAIFTGATAWRVYTVEWDPAHASASYLGDAQLADITLTSIPNIYATRWGCVDAREVYDRFKRGLVPQPVTVAGGQVTIDELDWSPPSHIDFKVNVTSQEAWIILRQCYVPLWQGYDEEADQKITFSPSRFDGLLEFPLPHGSHDVSIYLAYPPMEALGDDITLVALFLCAALILTGRRKPPPLPLYSEDFP